MEDCSSPGWSSGTTICFRLVHFQKDFWSAKSFCELQKGALLQLKHVEEVTHGSDRSVALITDNLSPVQVLDALGQALWGNAGEYRIDGWANGTWYHKDNEVRVKIADA